MLINIEIGYFSISVVDYGYFPYFPTDNRCLFRVLDSFGTEPQFNFKAWKPVAHSTSKKREYGQTWGNWELNPRQFLTMYRKSIIHIVAHI